MKKMEESVKPVSVETIVPELRELNNIRSYYTSQLNHEPLLAIHLG